MFKKILNTITTRLLSAIASFITLVIIAKYLKSNGLGIISLLTNTIFIMNLIDCILGGASLVYLIPLNRNRGFINKAIMVIYAWIIIISYITLYLLFSFGFISNISFLHTYILTMLASFSTSNALILLAFEKINKYNITLLLQIILNLIVFLGIKILKGTVGTEDFIISLYISYVSSLIYSFVALEKELRFLPYGENKTKIASIFKKLLAFGLLSQLSTIVQYLNYRISVFVLNKYSTLQEVGVYSVALRITEAIWMISSSIALVQYARISNQKNDFESIKLTIKLSKISLVVVLIETVVFLCIPQQIFSRIFGKEFYIIHQIGLALSIGIVSIGYSTIFAHYFSGKGRFIYNIIVCIIGFLINLAGNVLFVRQYGMKAAAFTSTTSYAVMSVLLVLIFIRKTKTPFHELFIHSDDVYDTFKMIKLLNKNNEA
jgi:O-antigen/teichoic acid export membrane protein